MFIFINNSANKLRKMKLSILTKRFKPSELKKTVGELPESDFERGGRIEDILDSLARKPEMDYNQNLLDWLENIVD